jgi:hypothetical protein
MIDKLEKLSAGIGRLIARGRLDPVEAAEFFWVASSATENPSFILVTRGRALEEAEAGRASSRGTRGGQADGVPIA